MANIQWTSSSINSFFQTSLNQSKSTAFNNMYSLLSEASMIRSGGYYKLMDAYYKEVKAQNPTSSESKKEETSTTSKLSDSYTSYDSNGIKTQNTTSILDELI